MKRFAFTVCILFLKKALYIHTGYIRQSLIIALLLMSVSVLRAQIKPDTKTIVPNATGTAGTPYKPADYTAAAGNYIRTYQPQEPTTDATYVTSSSRTVDQVNISTQYFDGLGRPLQTVGWQTSPDKKDIVAPVVYDEFGREVYQFLPYTSPTASTSGNPGQFKTKPFSEQSTFYTNTYKTEQPAITNEKYFYSKTNFEPSPLNRVSETYAPGNSWAGSEGGSAEKKVSVKYLINTRNADAVRIWHIDFNSTIENNTNIPYTDANDINDTYADGQLYKTVTIDEAGNAVVEYKDKEGQVILKKVQIGTVPADFSGYSGFLCTYYVYDDLNQLRTVLQPKAVVAALGNNWVTTQTVVNELCFRYEYDYRQRMIAKKVPGAGWVYMVYDVRDRLAFSQDANMKGKHQWMYTMYDDLNRPVQTGIMNYIGNQGTLQLLMPTTSSSTTTTNTGTGQPVNPADLYINGRENGRAEYKATTSIVFDNGFSSEDNASFTADIVTEAPDNFSDENVTVNTFYTPPGAILIPLTYTYYDNYDAATKTYSGANNSKLDNGGNPYPETLPTQKSTMTKGMVTVSKVRVIEDPNNLIVGKWLETDNFYDDKGRVIQVQSTNYKGGNDIVTNRYDFTNKVISTYLVHENAPGNISNLRVLTSMNYDHEGRLHTITKKINDDDANKRVIVTNTYDALGKLKNKRTGQKTATDPAIAMEDDNYNYNIRGWLKDINWYSGSGSYASQMNTGINKWFSMDLSYDWGFDNNASQYNGNISGTRWKTAGDGEERAYGFKYDAANRLLKGDFTQNNGGWNNSAGVNFSMQMGDGLTATSAYDDNGNIKSMQQHGLKINSSDIIDNMTYTYKQTDQQSNQLLAVREADDIGTIDNKLGDFTDKNRTLDDYDYDDNGNLIYDKNKKITSIEYNHLNLPWKITVNNDDGSSKGTITYIYDATGNKLEKRTNETAIAKQTTTTYLGGFIYENNVLQFFGHEEGRVRYKQYIDDNNHQQTSYVYDYFLKDHLGNVRMVLTEEEKTDMYPAATLETSKIATEENYYNINPGQIVDKSAATGIPDYKNNNVIPNPPTNATFDDANSDELYVLNKNSQKTGLGITLRVMSGDKIDIYGKSYYFQNNTEGTEANSAVPVIDILSGFLGSLSGAVTNLHGVVTATELNGIATTTTPINSLLNNQTNNNELTPQKPKAFINYILFDEQFKSVASGFAPVGGNAELTDYASVAALHNIAVNKNGYAYIWCSNESPVDVFFDNLQVVQTKGPVLEETHYYPFGLVMNGISSKAAGKLENRRKFNDGTELNTDFDLNWYETDFRSYDPQIGRFHQIDELTEFDLDWSPYVYAHNNPILLNDPLGLAADTVWKPLSPVVVTSKPKNSSVGQPGLGESLIPVWGSARAAVDDFQNGRWGWGIFNSVMAISDVFLIKSAVTAVGKLLVKGTAEIITKEAAKEGVYVITTKSGRYIGQSKHFLKRIIQHFGKGGKLSLETLEKVLTHEMAGSTKLEREVYEQYLIREAGGVDALINKVNPMGGRMDKYFEMIDGVIEKYGLPK